MALVSCHFFSDVLGLASTMTVLLPDLPPGPDGLPASPSRPFPVLYLLHGLSDDHTTWQRRTALERYLQGMNLAVVMPAVQRSFYANSLTGQRYWTFISEELPAIARAYFPLSTKREETYVAGLSMGGYGAFKLALTYPDRFAAAASLSGALDIVRVLHEEEEAGEDEFRYIFGPASDVAGGPNDLLHLAAQVARRRQRRPALYQACGTEDHLYEDNVRFHTHALALGLDITYDESPAGHTWSYWDEQIRRVLAWLPGLKHR
jgi:putative tributyrin esterase